MKRCVLGAIALVLLLALTLSVSLWQGQLHQELGRQMARAAETLDLAAAARVQAKWQRYRAISAVVADHEPMEEIDELFALLTTKTGEDTFREVCLQLSSRLKALGQGQLPTLENLF